MEFDTNSYAVGLTMLYFFKFAFIVFVSVLLPMYLIARLFGKAK